MSLLLFILECDNTVPLHILDLLIETQKKVVIFIKKKSFLNPEHNGITDDLLNNILQLKQFICELA